MKKDKAAGYGQENLIRNEQGAGRTKNGERRTGMGSSEC